MRSKRVECLSILVTRLGRAAKRKRAGHRLRPRREGGWSAPTRRQFEEMAGPEGAFLIGDPGTVAAEMLHASEALGGVSRVTFQMSTASLETAAMKRSIELLGTEVAPIVRAAGANP